MSTVISNKCTNCGICLPVCPTESISVGTNFHVIDFDSCISCLDCVPVCPVDAIKAPKKEPKKK